MRPRREADRNGSVVASAKKPSLTKGSVLMTATSVLTATLGYALNVFLARRLGPGAFGLFATVLTVATWLELVVAEGLPSWVIRVVDRDSEGPLIPRAYVGAQLGIAFILMAGLMGAASVLASVFGQPASAGPAAPDITCTPMRR